MYAIRSYYDLENDLVAAVQQALTRVEGSYAFGLFWAQMPDTLIAVRKHSPLVLGVDDKEGKNRRLVPTRRAAEKVFAEGGR